MASLPRSSCCSHSKAACRYEIADVTAAATFYIAETYFDFSRALVQSQRPTDLKAGELEQYELAIEEEAFPFEEKAIGVHEKNLELLRAGVFNPWTGKSLDRLAQLMPGRYAKSEMSAGFLGSIDIYAYRSPLATTPAPAPGAPEPSPSPAAPTPSDSSPEASIQTTQLEPGTAGGEVVAHANPQ